MVSSFQGKDGNAYLSKQDAINTYHDYQKVYQLGNISNNETNIEFQNKYEAVQYLENIVLKNLEKKFQTDRYEMAGSFFTKDQILSWLESTTDIQYNYNSYRWSKLSHPNLQEMQLTQHDEKNYIKRYSPPKDTYWLNLDARGLSGNFSGPLYIETNVSFNTLIDRLKNNWQKISSNTINALMTPLVLFSTFINVQLNSQKPNDDNSWNIKRDFFAATENGEEKFKKGFILANNDKYNEETNSFYFDEIEENLIKVSGMSRWEKTLAFLQNVHNYTLRVNHSGNEENTLAFTNLLRTMLKNVIKANTMMFEDCLDDIFQNQNNTVSNQELTFTDIIHMFINPSKFIYQSPSKVNKLTNVINKIQTIGDTIFDAYGKIKKIHRLGQAITEGEIKLVLSSYETFFQHGQKYYEIDGKKLSAHEAFQKVAEVLRGNLAINNDGSKIDMKTSFQPVSKIAKFAGKIAAGLQIAKAMWDIGNAVSPFKFNTYENDLGNGQKLYYQTTEFEIPILNIQLARTDPSQVVNLTPIKLFSNGSIISGDVEDESKQLFTMLGSLIVGKDKARQYLKEYILTNPTKFVATRSYYITVMSNQEIREIVADKNNPTDALKKLRLFVNDIFTKYFANNINKMYFDGINSFFSNPIDARDSLKTKITNNQFIIKYKFTDLEGITKYYDNEATLLKEQNHYLENNVLIRKTILQSDLIKTIRFDKLKHQIGAQSKVYSVLFNGQERYFLTVGDAKNYVYSNSDIVLKTNKVINYYVFFGTLQFNSESDFYKWVKDNTLIVNGKGEVIQNGN
ncbi:hypothetical protein SRED_002171 [Spiroplasma melliferum]|uniref:Uncharacterized protein n=2 Tax=Spiroplasma melliferum TaxID=2134 RepID=A0AAI9X0P4_SPIME|nr:hypothetical protein SPM_006000 [Spiroplasma melliferum KC3]QCO23700.1 hypothetical protein SRED_002171 [Spiroplasma melliferum]